MRTSTKNRLLVRVSFHFHLNCFGDPELMHNRQLVSLFGKLPPGGFLFHLKKRLY